VPLRKTTFDADTSPRIPAAIYARVSTDNQVGGRFDSCESQTAICREVVQSHEAQGWYEVVALTDAAYSGGSMNRPGIQTLKRMIAAGEVKVVVIFKLERLSRNIDEWGPFRAFLEKHGCQLVSATEDISEEEPEGRLKNNIMMSVNDFERRNTAKKTRIKMREQAKRGYWNGGHIPFGYAYDKNTQSLQIHPEEGPIVRRIFDQAAQLVSLTDIANALNADGLRTKQRVLLRRDGTEETIGGRMFRSDGLRLLIHNPLYRGAVRFEGIEYAAQHGALIPADVWDKANAATAETKPRPVYLFQERDTHNHLLKGLAWCAGCGRALVPNDSGKKSVSGVKYRYYTCSLVMREARTQPCAVGRLSADALERAVIALIGEASKHPALVSEMVDTSRRLRGGDREALRVQVEKIKAALATVDKKLANCAEAVVQGGAEALGEVLVRRATELRTERQRLLLDQERNRQKLSACEATVLEERRIRVNLDRLREVLPALPPVERKELIRLFVERVEVRRVASAPLRKAATEPEPWAERDNRIMELRIKLHLAELVQGMEERAAAQSQTPAPHRALSVRGLSLDARVDFTHAQRGEVTIITPFRQTLRLDARVRTVRKLAPEIEHPILRAWKWQEMLKDGSVATRLALAKKVGLTPSAITRIMKLVELAPDIQAHLASLKSASAVWHFGYKPVGRLATLPFNQQRAAFAQMRADFEQQEQRNHARQKTVPLSVATKPASHGSPRLSAG